MGAMSNLYRGRNDVDFPRLWRPFLIASGLMVVASLVSLGSRGLNLAIDFEGGAVWEVPSETLTVKQATGVLDDFGKAEGAKVQRVTDAKGHRIIRIQADTKDVKVSQKIAAAYAAKVGVKVEDVGTNTVGPSWGKEITGKALQSLIVFLVLITLYISWQLEWRMAAGALVGVVHDVIVTVGVYSIFQLEVTPATVISFLTILGYSLYDTIVVYDRLQENAARYDRSGQYTYTAVMRRSLNQVLMRSVNTTTVSILPVISMLLVGAILFGQVTLQDFSLALLIGLIAGAYSSIFIAAPLVAWLKEREPKYSRIRKRAVERDEMTRAGHIPVLAGAGGPSIVSDSRPTDGEARPASSPVAAAKASQYQRPHPPRPRKQGKRR